MAADHSFAGCAAYIYGENGSLLLKTQITVYDGKTNEIEISDDPGLKKGSSCKVVIDISPLPWEYMGRALAIGTRPASIALYGGKPHTSENRRNPRFKVRTSAVIESLIEDGRAYALHTPIEVGIINISRGGVRICTPESAIAVGVRFEMRLRIGDKDELLVAEAVNCSRAGHRGFEYGCSFLGKDGDIKERV